MLETQQSDGRPHGELLTRVEIVHALRGVLSLEEGGDTEAAMNIVALLHDRLLLEHHQLEKDMIASEVGAAYVTQ